MIFERLVQQIETNYERWSKGGHNFIPIGFNRFRFAIPGIIKSSITIVTASSGVGKSKYTRTYYVKNVLEFCIDKPELKPIIPVFSLELSPEEYLADIICSKLYEDYKIRISYRQLMSIVQQGDESPLNNLFI